MKEFKFVLKKILNRIIFLEIYSFSETLFSWVPGTLGFKLRYYNYKIWLKSLGKNVIIGTGCKFQCPRNISIGDGCHINHGVFIAANIDLLGSISLEEDVLIGPYSVIHSGNHIFSNLDTPISKQGFVFSPIKIERNSWLGSHCVVLSGVTIHSGAIIAAGGVVVKNIIRNSINGGVPSKIIKLRV